MSTASVSSHPPSGTELSDRRVGLIAGWGRYPLRVAEALREQGYEVYCLAIRNHADPVLEELCHHVKWVGLAKLGAALRYWRSHAVRRGMMAGKVFKTRLFERWAWLRHIPDARFLREFFHHFITQRKDRRDDSLLGAMVDAFARDGIALLPATDFVPEVLVKFGQLAGRRLSAAQTRDVDFGWRMAKEMGRLDIGQCVAVKGQTVLAVEAVEGTDECLRRAGQLCPAGGFTVVKVAKPQQDMRFDVPTIGLGTLQTLRAAGGSVLVVEAEKTILLDEPEVIAYAEQHGLALLAITPERLGELAAEIHAA